MVEQLLGLESCEEYVQTSIQTLDSIHVFIHQPHRFLPLAKEAKKLAEALKKGQDASQWAGIPHENLLQESFVEQLNSLQTLEQLASLQAAKEHLPQDIINFLELLGKADNMPFNQLYSLAEDCTDQYYTKVIKTLTQLLKGSFNDRQIILVNMARALKFLESYGNRQTKLWKVLSKYDKLSDHFHDLQTTLQTEFNLLKRPPPKTSKIYMMLLISNKHILHLSLATLIPSIQNWCSWTNRSKPIVFIPTPKQTWYRLMHRSTIPTSTVKQIHCQTYIHKYCHMLRTLKKIQLLSLPIAKSTPHFHRILIGLNLSLNQFRILQNAHHIRTLNNSGNNIKIAKVPIRGYT